MLKRKALPVAPVKRVEMSSDLLVKMVSQLAQEKRRVPPMWSKKMRPMVKPLGVTELFKFVSVAQNVPTSDDVTDISDEHLSFVPSSSWICFSFSAVPV